MKMVQVKRLSVNEHFSEVMVNMNSFCAVTLIHQFTLDTCTLYICIIVYTFKF